MDKLAFSVTETAQVLGVSRPTVYALMKQPGFPVFQVGGRKLISVDGLRNWVRNQTEVFAGIWGHRAGRRHCVPAAQPALRG